MTIYSDLGGNGKGVELSGTRLGVMFGMRRKYAPAPIPNVVSSSSPPPPVIPPPVGTYYYAPILVAGGI